MQVDLSDADSNIEFASAEGRRLLLSQTTSLESYFMLAQHFVTQDTLGYCGHASATMALNAVRSKKSIVPQDKRYPGKPRGIKKEAFYNTNVSCEVDVIVGYGYYTQESWVGQSCVSNALGEFRRGGMGILDLEGALNCNAHARSAIVNESQAMKTVVKSIRKAMDERKVVIVNVFRRELDEKGWVSDDAVWFKLKMFKCCIGAFLVSGLNPQLSCGFLTFA